MLYKVYYKDISTKERRGESKRPPKTPNMQNRKKKKENQHLRHPTTDIVVYARRVP
jgi:hypothetical protein